MPKFREFNMEHDFDAVFRIWLECGWVRKVEEEYLRTFIGSQRAWVAELDGSVECFVLTTRGDIRYLEHDLPLSCVSAVNTSRVARKRGLAARLTAHAIARDALEGASVSTLGAFEQGYYNNLGFGNGGYEHIMSFHPSHLRIDVEPGLPVRLETKDADVIHRSRLSRLRGHGSCNLYSISEADIIRGDNSFGMGYFGGAGDELTHYIWFTAVDVKGGPYRVRSLAYRNYDQFIELMGLIKGLGDQVRSITMIEPPGIQMQDLLEKPLQYRVITRNSGFQQSVEAVSFWQVRICDLEGCLSGTSLQDGPVEFNLRLSDPIENHLDPGAGWRGIGGDYVVSLGKNSVAARGKERSLPTLVASVNAFTRLWLGVLPATSLRVTDDLSGPDELLKKLDRLLRLPRPAPDWDF